MMLRPQVVDEPITLSTEQMRSMHEKVIELIEASNGYRNRQDIHR